MVTPPREKLQTSYDISQIPPFVVRADGKTLDGTLINLSANESPFGPSPKAKQAIADQQSNINRYPDMHALELKSALADLNGLDPLRIVCANGSDSILFYLALAYASHDHEIIMSKYSFTMFRRAALSTGAIPIVVEENDFTFSVANALAAVTEKTRILFIANPNNPTGSFISGDELIRLRKELPSYVLLVIDDAYQEYAKSRGCPNGLDIGKKWDNVVVTRTMSKIYGLAALRVGWAYASQEVANNLNRLRQPFNMGTMAQKAALAALGDQEFVLRNVKHNQEWQSYLVKQLNNLGLNILPSAGNFITVRFPNDKKHNASKAMAFLHKRKIIPRTTADYGMPDFLRITVGLEEENIALVSALKVFLES